jgi:predicted MPP superfamily phosphohydrolase
MMFSESYVPCGTERRWLDDLGNGRSLIILGERGSGLSCLADNLVYAMKNTPANSPEVIEVNARTLGHENGFLCDLALASANCVFTGDIPDEVESLLSTLRHSFSHFLLKNVFDRIKRHKPLPIIIIDHFECLAVKLIPSNWASLRELIESKTIQLILLSRLSISEIETLADSKLSQTIKQESLPPVSDVEMTRQLVGVVSDLLQLSEEVLSYINKLSGGGRSMIILISKLLLSNLTDNRAIDIPFVDQVIEAHRDEVLNQVTISFRGFEPVDDGLREEYLAELQTAIDIDCAPIPSVTVTPHSQVFKRLKRLGHFLYQQGGLVMFSSEILRSLIQRRSLTMYRNQSLQMLSYDEWLDYDQLVRRYIRQKIKSPVNHLLEHAGDRFKAVLDAWRRDICWWGKGETTDALDYLRADDLHDLVISLNLADEDWLRGRKEEMDLVAVARRTCTSEPWKRNWTREEKRRAASALASLRVEFEMLLNECETMQSPIPGERPGKLLRFLHLSDTHFSAEPKYGENLVLPSFLEMLEKQRELPEQKRLMPPPDLVLFTGDIAFSGKESEYQRAATFFKDLLRLLDLGVDRLFLVPGNHDVDRDLTKFLDRSLTKNKVNIAFRDERWRRLYSERLSAFNTFYRNLFAGYPERLQTTKHGFLIPQSVSIKGVELLLLLLNAQWCGGLNDDRGNLVLGLSVLKEDLAKYLEGSQSADLVAALMHQPVSYLASFEEQYFVTYLGKKIDMMLRGHVHLNEISSDRNTKGNLEIFESGALFEDDNHPKRASLIEVNSVTKDFSMYPVKYGHEQNRWERDTSLGEPSDYVVEGNLKDS